MPFIEGAPLEAGRKPNWAWSARRPTATAHGLRTLLPGARSRAHARVTRPAADGQRRLERRHESRRPGRPGRKRLARLLPPHRARPDDADLRAAATIASGSRDTPPNASDWPQCSMTPAGTAAGIAARTTTMAQPLGSIDSDECQIDALGASAGPCSPESLHESAPTLAIAAVEERLVDEAAGLIRLLDPPFDKTPQRSGLHQGLRAGRARKRRTIHARRAVLRPRAGGNGPRDAGRRAAQDAQPRHAHRDAEQQPTIYQTEPYVVAADVYSQPPHVGRGGWTWYTGSAGWMFRVAVESILGLSIEGGQTLVLRPAISSAWPSCKLNYRLPDGQTQYEITIENPSGKETGVTAATRRWRSGLRRGWRRANRIEAGRRSASRRRSSVVICVVACTCSRSHPKGVRRVLVRLSC